MKEAGDYELEMRPRLLKEAGKKRENFRSLFSPFRASQADIILLPVLFDVIKIKLHLSANSSGTISHEGQ